MTNNETEQNWMVELQNELDVRMLGDDFYLELLEWFVSEHERQLLLSCSARSVNENSFGTRVNCTASEKPTECNADAALVPNH